MGKVKQSKKPLNDYIVAIGASPLLMVGFAISWVFWAYWRTSNWFYLENGKYVKNGSWKWWWYRSMLGYQPVDSCPDCHRIVDSTYTTNLCECAFKLDMRGTK